MHKGGCCVLAQGREGKTTVLRGAVRAYVGIIDCINFELSVHGLRLEHGCGGYGIVSCSACNTYIFRCT